MILEVKQLEKQFEEQKPVLSNISFGMEQGEFVALLGLSGGGKSTLLRCLSSLEVPDRGSILFKGVSLTGLNQKQKQQMRRGWSLITQKTSLIQRKTAFENVLAGRLNATPLWRVASGVFSKKDQARAQEALERVGLQHKAMQRADRLSGGEQQRVAVARAIAQGAAMVYADEPVSSLDPESAKQVLQDLKSLCEEEKITVLCSLHQVELAQTYATRILGINGGKIVVDIPGRTLSDAERKKIYQRMDQGEDRT